MKKRNSESKPAPARQEPVPSLKEKKENPCIPQSGDRTADQPAAASNPHGEHPEKASGEDNTGTSCEKNQEKEKTSENAQPVSEAKAPEKPSAACRGRRAFLGRLMILLGFLLLLGAGLLRIYNTQEAQKAGQASAEMLPEVRQAIAEKVSLEATEPPTAPVHVNPYDDAAVEESNEMTIYTHNSWSYIGYLFIPKLDLELPILSEISQYNLGMAPCRHMGSTKSDDLVLAAHNYPFHFGRIRELAPGDPVSFVDMDGVLSEYTVVTVNIIDPQDVDAVKDPSLDLVLYTCTYGGQNRIMVGCQRNAVG